MPEMVSAIMRSRPSVSARCWQPEFVGVTGAQDAVIVYAQRRDGKEAACVAPFMWVKGALVFEPPVVVDLAVVCRGFRGLYGKI